MKVAKDIKFREWEVQRHGLIEEVRDDDGEISWCVTVWDNERDPFIEKYFSTRAAAEHFLERVRKDR